MLFLLAVTCLFAGAAAPHLAHFVRAWRLEEGKRNILIILCKSLLLSTVIPFSLAVTCLFAGAAAPHLAHFVRAWRLEEDNRNILIILC